MTDEAKHSQPLPGSMAVGGVFLFPAPNGSVAKL
jgi:hypothetical protein